MRCYFLDLAVFEIIKIHSPTSFLFLIEKSTCQVIVYAIFSGYRCSQDTGDDTIQVEAPSEQAVSYVNYFGCPYASIVQFAPNHTRKATAQVSPSQTGVKASSGDRGQLEACADPNKSSPALDMKTSTSDT